MVLAVGNDILDFGSRRKVGGSSWASRSSSSPMAPDILRASAGELPTSFQLPNVEDVSGPAPALAKGNGAVTLPAPWGLTLTPTLPSILSPRNFVAPILGADMELTTRRRSSSPRELRRLPSSSRVGLLFPLIPGPPWGPILVRSGRAWLPSLLSLADSLTPLLLLPIIEQLQAR